MAHSLNELFNEEVVCRTAPATPGMLIRETIPSKISDMGEKTISVFAHFFLLP